MSLSELKGYKNISILYTGEGIRLKDGRFPKTEDLSPIEESAIIYDSEKIIWLGKTTQIPDEFKKTDFIDLQHKNAIIPGLVDCHTHLVFSGDRANEFSRRCSGTTYEEIAAEGGGILTTVKATRFSSEDELFQLGCERLLKAKNIGIRTIEMKSGYGLSFESELKILRVIKKLKKTFSEMLIQSTFLGAHDFPKEQTRDSYLDEVIHKMIPEIADQKLADACDVFVDEGFYTLEEAKQILEQAKKFNLKVKIHADELKNTESATFAANENLLSADHLLKISDDGIKALSKSNTVAVILPGTAFYLKAPQAPAKKMIDAGVKVAISTDFNPGTCHSLNLPLMMTISALYQGLSAAELFAAVTYNAASALGFQDVTGTLEIGKKPLFTVLETKTFEELYYRF